MSLWGMSEADTVVCGSLRRGRADVGDIDLVCPRPEPGKRDELFEAIDASVTINPLFGPGTVPVGRALEGLRSGFRSCALAMELTHQPTGKFVQVGVQIHRHHADGSNRGWITVIRTGPKELHPILLGSWKRRQGIPDSQPGSRDGDFVDQYGHVVPTPTEHRVFELCGFAYRDPEQREALVRDIQAARGEYRAIERR
jgi:hypothetical protein